MAHIFTAVFGSGVLALPWSVAQLGWIAGPLALIGFSCVTYYTSTMLADTYRAPDPVTGSRNRTYMEAVRAYLSKNIIIFMLLEKRVNIVMNNFQKLDFYTNLN
jgi:amino acid permease